ncbi:uncharacterized protein LOC121594789 isoform X4 [Anopheles merus]|uniref:uncharacterized protein LOC121594789 isoform X4 n=1 Tax=Anopheles merus TaxID=30066 RepID=UPI001BE3E2C1|nr:uncharacterized protein LOC121594789 isoform X4 [Anopheles merus]
MKFGNYNLTSTATEPCDNKRRHLSLFRPGKVKSTANYIVGKVHRRLGSIVSTRMSSSVVAGSRCLNDVVNVEHENIAQNEQLSTACFMKSFISNGSESSSTLSYRASLFGEQDDMVAKGHREREITIPRFSPKDFPTSWIGKNTGLDSTLFDLQGKLCNGMLGSQQDDSGFQPFGSRAQLFHKNKSITGKHGILPFSNVEGAQLFPYSYHSLKSGSTLRRSAQNFGGSCPEIHAASDTMQSRKSYKSQRSSNVSNGNGSNRFRKSKIVQLLERNESEDNDETVEMAILQEYFDTMSYTEIVKDRDFRNYLMKKRYLDIMEYIYNSSGASDNGQFSRAPSTMAPPSISASNNDCDSVKKEKLRAESVPSPTLPPQPPIRRYYSSNSNSQVFCRRNSSFEQYYHNQNQHYGTLNYHRTPGNHSFVSSRRLEKNRDQRDVPPYATLLRTTKAKAPSRCQRTYRQIRAFCEKSLMKYSLNRSLNGSAMTLKKCKPARGYSEKQYRRVINDFVRQRGFSSADEYTRYHYGNFLRHKLVRTGNRRSKKRSSKEEKAEKEQYNIHQQLLYNSLPPPPYSSGDYHHAPLTPVSRESKATTPTARNLPTNLLFEFEPEKPSLASTSLPNVCDLICSDRFKNFDYVNQAMTLRRCRRGAESTTSAGCRLNDRRQIFLPVNSDGEEELLHGPASSFLPPDEELQLGEVIARSDQTNLPYIFDDIGVYETIRSRNKKELLRAEMRSRKESFINAAGEKYAGLSQQRQPTFRNSKMDIEYQNYDEHKHIGYKDEMLSEEMSSLVPPGLQGKADILFGNLHELYTFHNDIFLKDLENCISTTELVALCFVQRRDTFFRLYSYYCQNIPRSERLRETLVDTHLFLQECQKKLGHKLPLAAYLLKPVQRITKYQLLLKDLLKFSDTGTCSRELQKALDCMLVVLKCVNDSMHQIAITGFPADLSQQGELLMQDSFQVWTESKKDLRLRLKTQNRHIFLYQKAMLFCKQGSKTGHNKSTYQFKHWLQMSQIGLTESVRGDSRRFEVWLQGRQEVHTIQATTIEIKNKWVAEIKRVLLNQLEELKGEKIKQYGLNHKPLRHMTSWDVPQAVQGTPNRILSSDQQPPLQANGIGIGGMVGLAQDVVTRIAHMNDDSLLNATGISCSSSEHDNQESNAWSSDYSNSEDEFTTVEDSVVPGHKFVSLADYCAMGNSEVSMKEAEVVELLKVGCAGWWFVKVIATGLEGWAPAAYLEPVARKNSRLRSARSQDRLNDH